MAGKTGAGSAKNGLAKKAAVWMESHRAGKAASAHISRFWLPRIE